MHTYQEKDIQQFDRNHLWHPFTQMKHMDDLPPLMIKYGKGSYVFDFHDNAYLDCYSSLWVNVHGHNNSELNESIIQQLSLISHSTLLGACNVPSSILAAKLAEITPDGLNKVFYSDTGSAAVEIGLKIAYQYWQNEGYKEKKTFINLTDSYHGDTIGSVSVGGVDLFHSIFKPLLFETYQLNAPHPYGMKCSPEEALSTTIDQLRSLLEEKHEEVCGIIMEPLMQGAAGMIRHPDGFLKAVKSLADEFNVLLIVDEVATGFGRTGEMFACNHEAVTPDIMSLGKGITGGYLPLAATMTTDEIYNAFLGSPEEHKTFYHGHTYTGNQLCTAAALKNIEMFEQKNLISQIQETSRHLKEQLNTLTSPLIDDIRGVGMMYGIELKRNNVPLSAVEMNHIVYTLRNHGVLTRNLGNVLTIVPILSMSTAEIDQMIDALKIVLNMDFDDEL